MAGVEGGFAGDVRTAARAGLGEGWQVCSGVVGGDAGEQTADELDALLSSLAMRHGATVGPETIELSESGLDLIKEGDISWADLEAVPILDLHDGGQYMDFSSMPEILSIVGGPYPEENYVRCPHAIPLVPYSNE